MNDNELNELDAINSYEAEMDEETRAYLEDVEDEFDSGDPENWR
jgi:hypothetical protein